MTKKIFVVGPPASGKTTICKEIINCFNELKLTATYLTDVQVLREFLHRGKFEAVRVGQRGDILINDKARELIYKELARLAMSAVTEFVLVEAAPLQIELAFSFYPPIILNQSTMLYTISTLKECLFRNRQRGKKNQYEFNAFVPEQVIKSFFSSGKLYTELVEFSSNFQNRFEVQNTGNTDIATLKRRVGSLTPYFL